MQAFAAIFKISSICPDFRRFFANFYSIPPFFGANFTDFFRDFAGFLRVLEKNRESREESRVLGSLLSKFPPPKNEYSAILVRLFSKKSRGSVQPWRTAVRAQPCRNLEPRSELRKSRQAEIAVANCGDSRSALCQTRRRRVHLLCSNPWPAVQVRYGAEAYRYGRRRRGSCH